MSHAHIPTQRHNRVISPDRADLDAYALVQTFRNLRAMTGAPCNQDSDARCIAAASRLNNDLAGIVSIDALWHRSRIARILDTWLDQEPARTRDHWAMLDRFTTQMAGS